MPSRPRSLRKLSFGLARKQKLPEPPSPTFSEVTNASAFNFGANGPSKIITRANLKASIQSYEDLMTTSAAYRSALLAMSKATSAFADAVERCSGLKGPSYEAGTRLQAASGLHHLIGNLWQVLAETLDKKFEKPLRQHLDTYKTIVKERSASYERALKEKSHIIHETEMRNLNRKERNLQSFREALAILQRQVDELDELKASHYQEIMEHEEEVWDVVQNKVCLVVRSTMDVFDRITAKASDPIIEPMLQSVPDPFDAYGPPQSEDQIFSILAPLSIMSQQPTTSSVGSPLTITPEPELETSEALPSSLENSKVTSWLPTTTSNNNSTLFPVEVTAWADVHSDSPPCSTPRPITPPKHSHSHSSSLSRRHSVPSPPSRKSESKLRSVLSVIDEGSRSTATSALRRNGNGNEGTEPTGGSADRVSVTAAHGRLVSRPLHHEDTDMRVVESQREQGIEEELEQPEHSESEPERPPWSFTYAYGKSPYEHEITATHSGSSTPRNSTLFTSSITVPSDAPRLPLSESGCQVSDDQGQDHDHPTASGAYSS